MGVIDVAATLLLLRFWLTPEEYGIATIAATLYPMLDLVGEAGMTSAIVQRDEVDRDVLTTAFWVASAAAGLVAVVLFGLGPALAYIHGHAVVAGLFIIYGAKLAIQNLYLVPVALLRRELRFKPLAGVRLAGAAAEFVGKIGSAAAGLGVWCFPIGHLAKSVALIVAAQSVQPFWPRGRFVRARARELLHFGSRTMSSQVLFHLYTNVDYQIVSYAFGATATGLYRAAYELVLEPAKLLSYIIVDVAFPVFSRLRSDRVALRDQLLSFTRQNAAVLAPMVAVMLLVPEELLSLAYGPGWSAAAPAVRILCAVAALRALSYLLPPLLDGLGRADLTLRYMVVAAIAVPAVQMISASVLAPQLGWESVAVGWAVGYPVAFAVLAYLALSQISLSPVRWLSAIVAPAFTAMLATAAAAVLLHVLPASTVIRIAGVGGSVLAIHAAALALLMRRRAHATS
jgi:O-antigen/teichoic acid export membrane protein